MTEVNSGLRLFLVEEVVRDLLGPRLGPDESTERNPLGEYVTGILRPVRRNRPSGISEAERSDPELEFEVVGDAASYEEDDEDLQEQPPVLFSPALDPKNPPSMMGISFMTDGPPTVTLELCITWGRYFESVKSDGDDGKVKKLWKRHPRYWNRTVTVKDGDVFYLVPGKNGEAHDSPSPDRNAEVSLHIRVTEGPGGKGSRVHIHLVNRINDSSVDGTNAPVHTHIFQPSIRVLLGNGTRLLPLRLSEGNEQEEELDFIYRNRPVYARGYLCSAVWRDIDPERPHGDGGERRCLTWADGKILPPDVRERFLSPDVRSEFLPVYAAQAPSFDWDDSHGSRPELDPERLSSTCSAEKLIPMIEPVAEGYRNWLARQKEEAAGLTGRDAAVAKRLIDEAERVLKRIERGIDLLRTDPDARLAFAFANRAMWLQARWKNRSLKWRPFQLGFLISVIESVANPDSEDRKVCDLLWVPTGGGKTEAYLALVAFTLAYRRRRVLRDGRDHLAAAGTAVISRYTLRLLTLQQFRRTLSTVTACEYLRVAKTEEGTVGWRPGDCRDGSNFIWGTVRFSLGLWVGGALTPNALKDSFSRGRKVSNGALGLLQNAGESTETQRGEPAQVIRCPACDALLAIPGGGIGPGEHEIHLVLSQDIDTVRSGLQSYTGNPFSEIPGCSRVNWNLTRLPSGKTVLSLRMELKSTLTARDFNGWWEGFSRNSGFVIESASAARPGYFIRFRRKQKQGKGSEFTPVDFEIWCPNPECPLGDHGWFESVPEDDYSHYSRRAKPGISRGYTKAFLPGGELLELPGGAGYFRRVIDAWHSGENLPFTASRIPVPAYTVDEQLYARLPSVIIGTADKFARLSYEPKTGNLFGRVNFYSPENGYEFREPGASGRTGTGIEPLDPPDLILQDELHLVEGPLGSIMGLYEIAVDRFSSRGKTPVKYVASTATIREAESQVQAVFGRSLAIFPPRGLDADDRFFIRTREPHPYDESRPGQLFLGFAAPGGGSLKPLYRLWAILLQAAWERRNDPDYRYFRTLTGYFNAVRELAGVRAMMRQDIPAHVNTLGPFRRTEPRRLKEETVIELSSRIDSTDLPAILANLESSGENAPDALLATSMFGTGVDVSRLSLMIVHGQPKTTASYIQAAGRVGRERAALVITFYRVTRPRDLSHYEFFGGYHRQMYRFVEPVTVMPFSPGALDFAAGPVAVALLRNGFDTDPAWRENPLFITEDKGWREAHDIAKIFQERRLLQPELRRPDEDSVGFRIRQGLDRWRSIAESRSDLKYEEYFEATRPVVLGTPDHERAGLSVVYRNAPQSLREVEEKVLIRIK
ncbi:MAG: Superfamily II DNA and RNA helicase [Hydrogenibacillus schlegelii]|uniref:Superfamily II DNA and RNA helicase n=1 Tax=Hydrogenibacillus schlegelii TaxID=1484 RepID=A0A2T5G4R2_HYDSH|nr:DISARM system helicase DrmA [Hydrogenibacillus schlegelii]PTQ51172.1 MAG: Superfamily II DNA and RNA helicase [Hydrogenibacillus schlegelii]